MMTQHTKEFEAILERAVEARTACIELLTALDKVDKCLEIELLRCVPKSLHRVLETLHPNASNRAIKERKVNAEAFKQDCRKLSRDDMQDVMETWEKRVIKKRRKIAALLDQDLTDFPVIADVLAPFKDAEWIEDARTSVAPDFSF